MWGAARAAKYLEKRVTHHTTLDASVKVLVGKGLQISFMIMALFVGLSAVGIDVSSLALFGSAIGVGIGFGLQKIVSNLFCGAILLIDGSIKPGDVIALDNGNIYGWVNRLSSRCVSVRTRAGEEHLIPNEDFITQKVENWSYSDKNKRLRIPVGVSFDTDVPKAMELLAEATKGLERILKHPEPAARLIGFGDSAVDLELRIWISSPEKGVRNVISDVYVRIWELFREHNIQIPYPQRDIHIKGDRSFPE
jgi:small-conductance mechanosensitive channel